jgi:hypothetical protein
MFIWLLLLLIMLSPSLVAEEDPESYLWKQGTVQIIVRGISACTRTHELVTMYKTFATQGIKASKTQYRDTAFQAEKKIDHFQNAQHNYVAAEKHYKEALELFMKAKNMYITAKSSATRSHDSQLPTYQTLARNQIKAADKIYKKALRATLEGNRSFNQAIRYFNSGVDAYELETNEPLPKRYKFHRWPIEKLQ